jgi:hypothetical protein
MAAMIRTAVLLLWTMAAMPATATPEAAFVVMGDGGAIARAITAGPVCPAVDFDGKAQLMRVRFAAGTVPLRPTASPASLSKLSVFPLMVCDAALPANTRRISIDGKRLPVPRADIRRIVVIGDTGCRLKVADAAYQPCNDPAAFPFARIAASAAAWKPDLVIHVGDYHYRENPCPQGNAGCADSPWGYGWDAWAADFFTPAATLLAAAPLAPARGNHEICARAGQGWWRFLDGRPRAVGQDCDDPANDHQGDLSDPYAIDLGHGARLVMMDLAAAGGAPLTVDDWRVPAYQHTYARVAELGSGARFAFAVNHYPILGFAGDHGSHPPVLKPGNLAIQSVFGSFGPRQMPPEIDVLLAGHVHLWQQTSFASDHPSQFITGFSGTLEDDVPMPTMIPSGSEPAPGAVVDAFSSWVTGFGFMTMERTGSRSWRVVVRDRDGKGVNRCTITGRRSHCRMPQVAAVR